MDDVPRMKVIHAESNLVHEPNAVHDRVPSEVIEGVAGMLEGRDNEVGRRGGRGRGAEESWDETPRRKD